MSVPKIKIRQQSVHTFLWLKYVTGVDLRQHCARSLHGGYSTAVKPEHEAVELELAEFPHPIAWYLCGVTRRWGTNAHLAFEATEADEVHELEIQGLRVELHGGRPIPFGPEAIPSDDPNAGDRAFSTCRNWQFAHHLAAVHGLTSIPNRAPRSRTSGWVRGQMRLL
ncbi:hypothetical protein [Streptomyces sp. NPDC049555]|uniref:hypothetical protein n=1 Tax=Streptomyces sp. NPDC049555 TaxID=3154930 RepID=UPI0034370C51